MRPLEVYEELLKLRDDPDKFEERAAAIWEQFVSELPPEKHRAAQQFNWSIQGQLRQYKDPTARMNKMVELFMNGLQTFQLALQNPDALIARTQDGSKAVVLPINRKKPTS